MGFPFRRHRNPPVEERPKPRPRLPPPPAEPAPVLPDGAAAVGDEVEAFLQGRLVDYFVARSRPVPAWTVLNKVAHATADELAALAGGPGKDPTAEPDEPRWRSERRALAAQLLEDAPTPQQLADVQRKALVPLELWEIERSRTTTVTSRCVVEMATEVLDDLRADR